MSSVCLSLVATLRCAGLQPSQNIAILLPPFIEAIVTATLIYTEYGSGRTHWLLVGESWLYLLLAIVDFASKANSGIALNLGAYTTADRFVGALSGFPILLFTLFLLMLAKHNLVSALPSSYHWVTKALLMAFIPLIFLLSELGSLLGIGYAVVPVVPSVFQVNPFAGGLNMIPPNTEITVRFFSENSKTVWTFLNSTALAFLLIYQFFNFLLAVVRIGRHFMGRQSKAMISSRRSIGGIGWIAAGIKLGAIDTLLGFIPVVFEVALARRLLRMFGRGFLVYGVANGLDGDNRTALFRVGSIDSIEGLPPRRVPVEGGVRGRIGGPVPGTFAKLSPSAAGFNVADMGYPYQYGLDEKYPVPPRLTVRNATTPSTAYTVYPDPRYRPERVTIMYDGKLAPVLDIRFSELQFGDPTTLLKKMEEAKHRPSPLSRSKAGTPVPPPPKPPVPELAVTGSPLPFSKYSTSVQDLQNPFADRFMLPPSRLGKSDDSDSFQGLRQISNQFPPAPSNRGPFQDDSGYPLQRSRTLPEEELRVNDFSYGAPEANPPRSTSINSSHSKRKPAPIVSPSASQSLAPSIKSAGVVEGDGPEAAERTRRRLRTHFAQLASADDGARLTTKTQDGLYPPPMVVAARKRSASDASDSFLPDTDDDEESELGVSSSYESVNYREKPVGRLANRAFGIEKVLDEEKARKSLEGSRPGTGIDLPFIIAPINEGGMNSGAATPRKPWLEDEEDAREAFAAAWRTVAPTTPSPTVASLKNVNSVTARKTATVTTPSAAATTYAETGMIGSAETEDRALLRRNTLRKRASMDSDVY